MSSVDNRIVNMEFNNKQFEAGISQTMQSLDGLKQKLVIDSETSTISKNLDKIASRFTTLGIIGTNVISNITNKITNLGLNTITSAINQIKTGGLTRALNIEQAKFQLEGLGIAWDSISGDIDYAVKDTAYGLDSAAKAASQLSASGVQLGDDMKAALRGISGVAAMTNSSYDDIANVFTRVAGNGRLFATDLNSLGARGINAAATLAKTLGVTEKEVRDMTSKGTINFQMFAKAMDDAYGEHAKEANKTFTGSLSNVKAALSRIGAEFYTIRNNNLKDIFNALIPVLNSIKKSLTPIIELFDKFATSLKEKIVGFLNGINSEKVEEFFNSVTQKISSFISGIKSLFAALKPNEKIIDNLKRTLNGLFAIIQLVFNLAKNLISLLVKKSGRVITQLIEGITSITAKIGDFFVKLNEAEKKTQVFKSAFDKISSAIDKCILFIDKLIEKIKNLFSGKNTKNVENIKKTIDKTADKVERASSPLKKIVNVLQTIWEMIVKIGATLAKFIKNVFWKAFQGIWKAFNELDLTNALRITNTGIFAALSTGILIGIQRIITYLGKLSKSANGIVASFRSIFSGLASVFKAVANDINADALKKFSTAVLILAAAMLVLSLIDADRLAATVAVVSGLIVEMAAIMKIMTTFNRLPTGGKGGFFASLSNFLQAQTVAAQSRALISFAIAIGVLAVALKIISAIDIEKLPYALLAITMLIEELLLASIVLSKYTKGTTKAAFGLILFAAAISILAKVLKNISSLSLDELKIGLTGLSVIILELISVATILGNKDIINGSPVKAALSLVIFVGALALVAKTVKKISALSNEELFRGILGITAIITELMIVAAILGSSKISEGKSIKAAFSLIIFSTALLLMGASVKKLAALNWNELARGLTGISAVVTLLLISAAVLSKVSKTSLVFSKSKGFINFAKEGTAILKMAAALVIFSASVSVLANVMKKMAALSWGDIGKGITVLISLIGTFMAFTTAFNVKTKGGLFFDYKQTMAMTFALNSFAFAFIPIVHVFKAMEKISWMSIAKGVTAMASVIAILGASAVILKAFTKPMLLISAAVSAFGIGIALVGAGVFLLATGLTALGASLSVAGAGIYAFILSLIKLIPAVIEEIGRGIVAFCRVIVDSADAIVETIVSLIKIACSAIIEAAPEIFKTIINLLDILVEYIPQIVDKVSDIIISVIENLATKIPKFIVAIGKFIKNLFNAIGNEFKAISFDSFTKAIKDLAIATGILTYVGKLGPSAIKGIAIMAAVIGATGLILAAIAGLNKLIPGLNEFLKSGVSTLETIGYALGSFFGNIAGGFMAGMSNGLPEIATNLSDFMNKLSPFIAGAKEIKRDAMNGVKTLAETILILTGANFLDRISKFLGSKRSLADFGESLPDFGEAIKKYSDSVADINAEDVQNSAVAGKAIAELARSLPNSGGLIGKIVGNNDLDDFADMLEPFGKSMVAYSKSVKGIDADAITASTIAGKSLSELADSLPNSGGFIGAIVGNNDLDDFGKQLYLFGRGMFLYYGAIKDIKAPAITASAIAGKALVSLANELPNVGGLISLIVGNKDLGSFGVSLVPFGKGLCMYSNTIEKYKLNPAAVSISAKAAKPLVELLTTISKSNGIFSAFGENIDLALFSSNLVLFGQALAEYCSAVSSDKVDTDLLTDTSTAAGPLVTLLTAIREGGGSSIFESLADAIKMESFSANLVLFGQALGEYCSAVSSDKVDTDLLTDTATAAGPLVTLLTAIREGGGSSIFTSISGAVNMTAFSTNLSLFGQALGSYCSSVGSDKVDTDLLTDTSTAAGPLVTLLTAIREGGGSSIFASISGATNMAAFNANLALFGQSLSEYCSAVSGDKVNTDLLADTATAAGPLVTLLTTIRDNGGSSIFASFANAINMAAFNINLAAFGQALGMFSATAIQYRINPEAIKQTAEAAKPLVELLTTIREGGGTNIFSSLSDAINMTSFNSNLVEFAKALVAFSDKIEESYPSYYAISYATMCAKPFIDLLGELKDKKLNNITISASLADNMANFGDALTAYSNSVEGLNFDNMKAATEEASALFDIFNSLEDVDTLSKYVEALTNLGNVSSTGFGTGIANSSDEVKTAINGMLQIVIVAMNEFSIKIKTSGENAAGSYSKGFAAITDKVISVFKTVYSNVGTNTYNAMYNIGRNAGEGMVQGLRSKKNDIVAAADDLGTAAARQEQRTLRVNSPSKVFYGIFLSCGEGAVLALADSCEDVGKASDDLGNTAIKSISDAISNINMDEIDTTPVISPVLDLNNIRKNAPEINKLVGGNVMYGFDSINKTAGLKNQNRFGSNVLKAIDGLNDNLSNINSNSYVINGLNVSDANVAEVIQTLVRAMNIERRM